MTNFIETLKDLMIEKDLSQVALAKKLDVKPPTITRYIKGKQLPNVEMAVKIANLFNCTLDYLFGIKDNNDKKEFHTYPSFNVRFAFLLDYFKENIIHISLNSDIAKSAMYDWRNGAKIPTMDSIIKLAAYFKCPIDFVVGRVDFE